MLILILSNNFPNGEPIVNEYTRLDFANKIHDGYGFNIKEMDEEQKYRFYEVLTKIVDSINLQ